MPMTNTSLPACRSGHRSHARARAQIAALLLCLLAGGVGACSPDRVLGDKPLPPDVPDPTQTHTAAGAIAAYHGALVTLRNAFAGNEQSYVPVSGLLTDELRYGDLGQIGSLNGPMLVDSRFMPEDPGVGSDAITASPIIEVYGLLHKVRGQAREARGALLAYAPDSSPSLVGHLDAVEAYADVFLADLFCSGVPLSTLDFGGDFTYAAGSSTEEVYAQAMALFDSALAVSTDSEAVMNLARLGKGRVLLALGRYAEAAQAVADVPDDFRYALQYSNTGPAQDHALDLSNRSFVFGDMGGEFNGSMPLTVADTEGGNGLPFLSSRDPRSASVVVDTNRYGHARWRLASLPADGSGSIVLASGVEARLIQAEAALQAGGADWLAMLNALRNDGTFDTRPDSADPAQTDTLWHAGSGGVPGLAPLSDPGTPDERLSLLFQERGYWLFLTGHRQGDLRRLVRAYGRQQQYVFPIGTYPGAYNTYGTDVTAPIPGAERISNPLFTGCRSRGA